MKVLFILLMAMSMLAPASKQITLTKLGTVMLHAPEDNSRMRIDRYDTDGNKKTAELFAFHYMVDNGDYTSHLKGYFKAICIHPLYDDIINHWAVYEVLDKEAKCKGVRICKIPATYARVLIRYAKSREGVDALISGDNEQFEDSFGAAIMEKAPPIFDEINYLKFKKDGKTEFITPPSESPGYNRR